MDNPIELGELSELLSLMYLKNATDLFVTVGVEPTVIVDGNYYRASDELITSERIQVIVASILSEQQQSIFNDALALDFGVEFPEIGRVRLNFYFQKGHPAIVARFIGNEIPDLKDLGIPNVVKEMATEQNGLILIVGAAGSGKSTTMASMLDYRNRNCEGHILTIEDPIEYTHNHKMCLISQREIGIDTKSYKDALKYALREKPDTIMIGEIRDTETAKYALRFAETGHLCLSTLHANNTPQAIDRFLNLFPLNEHHRIRHDLSQYLVAIIAQRFAFSEAGSRVLVSEIMLNNHFISTLIAKGETEKIRAVMGEMDNESQTFDKVLCELVNKKIIRREEALRVADSRINLSLMMQSGDDTLYDSDYDPEEATPEDAARKQRLIDMAKKRKEKKAQRGK